MGLALRLNLVWDGSDQAPGGGRGRLDGIDRRRLTGPLGSGAGYPTGWRRQRIPSCDDMVLGRVLAGLAALAVGRRGARGGGRRGVGLVAQLVRAHA